MPWREMRDMLRFVEHDLERLMNDPFFAGNGDSSATMNRFWHPIADIHENDAGVVIKIELPGVSRENIQVALSGDGRYVKVSGTRCEDSAERSTRTTSHQLELFFGPFERTFMIPPHLQIRREAITATLENGFLNVYLPAKQKNNTEHIIPIEVK
jgi:HSP20 family protein